MQNKIELDLIKNYNYIVNIKAVNKDSFMNILNILKNEMPVFNYDKSVRKYRSNIFYLDLLEKICEENDIELYCSNRLIKLNKKFKKKFANIKKVDDTFETIHWTKDKSLKLFKYQNFAINACMRSVGIVGGLPIGDDMGLGKTMEAIAVICKMFEEGFERALIVLPSNLKHQWKKEFLKFTTLKEDDIIVVDGGDYRCKLNNEKCDLRSAKCRKCEYCDECKMYKSNPSLIRERQISDGKIVIINYELVRRESKILKKQDFDVWFMDEATGRSGVKNCRTESFKILKDLRYNSKYQPIAVFPMSGTFIENRLEDIYGSLYLINRNIVGEYYNFKNHYLVTDYFGNVVGYKNEKYLKKLLRKWLVRRTIDQVWKDRPELIEIEKKCIMSDKHRDFYEKVRNSKLNELKDLELQDKMNVASIGALLNYLLQVCDSTETIDKNLKESCKLNDMIDLVNDEISNDKKIVIFSFFANKMIPIIVRELDKLKIGGIATITGNTKKNKIEKIKSDFNNTNKIRFLVCSDAAAYGQNLQSAEYVINFDLPWNPAVLDQRIRRVYRKGQDKTVTVVNFVTENSVEDNVLEKIFKKRKLFDYFIGSNRQKVNKPSLKSLLSILKA